MIRPPSTSQSSASLQQRKGPVRFVAMMSFHPASVVLPKALSIDKPCGNDEKFQFVDTLASNTECARDRVRLTNIDVCYTILVHLYHWVKPISNEPGDNRSSYPTC